MPGSTVFELQPEVVSFSPQGKSIDWIGHLNLNNEIYGLIISRYSRFNNALVPNQDRMPTPGEKALILLVLMHLEKEFEAIAKI